VPQSEKGFFEVTNMVIRADKKLSVTFP
jgi:hypothetical protein